MRHCDRGIWIGFLWIVLAAGAAQVNASTFYQVDATASSVAAHTSGDGLIISTSLAVADGYSFSLSGVGDSHTFNFFKISTPEDWVNVPEDTLPRLILATLAFNEPASAGTVTGTTAGVSAGIRGFYQAGKVQWSGPVQVNAATGIYDITLSDETFNEGCLWTGPGKCGAIVEATIRQISLVPLPVSVSTGMILLGMLAVHRLISRVRHA